MKKKKKDENLYKENTEQKRKGISVEVCEQVYTNK